MVTKEIFQTLAIVSAPHHILYVLEAVDAYQLTGISLLVIYRSPGSAEIIDMLVGDLELPVISSLSIFRRWKRKVPSLFELAYVVEKKVSGWEVDNILLADYGGAIAANLTSQRLILLGDGTKQICVDNDDPLFTAKQKKHRMLDVFLRPFNLSITQPPVDIVFSPFVQDGPRTRKNTLAYHRKIYAEIPVVDTVNAYFFGAYFSENEVMCAMPDDVYMGWLEKIRNKYCKRGLNFVYVPHRQEGERKLLQLEKQGYQIERFSRPAELEFIQRGFVPRYIASFYSTCLYHFGLLCPESEVVAFRPPLTAFHPSYADSVEQVYDWYAGRLEVLEI